MYSLIFCITIAGQCTSTGKIPYPDIEKCESQQKVLMTQMKIQRKEYNYILCVPGT